MGSCPTTSRRSRGATTTSRRSRGASLSLTLSTCRLKGWRWGFQHGRISTLLHVCLLYFQLAFPIFSSKKENNLKSTTITVLWNCLSATACYPVLFSILKTRALVTSSLYLYFAMLLRDAPHLVANLFDRLGKRMLRQKNNKKGFALWKLCQL